MNNKDIDDFENDESMKLLKNIYFSHQKNESVHLKHRIADAMLQQKNRRRRRMTSLVISSIFMVTAYTVFLRTTNVENKTQTLSVNNLNIKVESYDFENIEAFEDYISDDLAGIILSEYEFDWQIASLFDDGHYLSNQIIE